MKILLILRHAKSSWKDPGLADHDRPLKKRGKRDAPRMGRLLHTEALLPDLIVSSTAKRAHKTATAVAKSCRYAGEIELMRALYHAGTETYLQVLRELSDEFESVMVVGHNPGLEELLEALTKEHGTLPTAALAQVALPIDSWRELGLDTEGTLVNLWRPRDLI